MMTKLSKSLTEQFPNIKLTTLNQKLLSICQVDGQRCISTTEVEDDYSILSDEVVRVFTTYNERCEGCLRNVK